MGVLLAILQPVEIGSWITLGGLIIFGLVGAGLGLTMTHRWTGLRSIIAALAVLAGIIAFLGGVIILILPNFFVT